MALAAITPEDLELDRELERISRETPPSFDDNEPVVTVSKEKDDRDLLSEFVEDYKPALTISELDAQVFQAKNLGADSIEASAEIIRHFCGKNYGVDYFMYKDIKVYLTGQVEGARAKDALTMEQTLFGKSKVK